MVKFFIVDRVEVVTPPSVETLSLLPSVEIYSSSRESLEHAVVIIIDVIATATTIM